MSLVLQGTTPLMIVGVPEDVPLSEVEEVEFKMWNAENDELISEFKKADFVFDTDQNVMTRLFSEAETMDLPESVSVQARFFMTDKTINGTLKTSYSVIELFGGDTE